MMEQHFGWQRLHTIQQDHKVWVEHNFPLAKLWHPVMGAGEEIGELQHAFLKRDQQIRMGNIGYLTDEIKDAVGDTVMFLLHLCNNEGWELADIIEEVYARVHKRDWIANPETGRV